MWTPGGLHLGGWGLANADVGNRPPQSPGRRGQSVDRSGAPPVTSQPASSRRSSSSLRWAPPAGLRTPSGRSAASSLFNTGPGLLQRHYFSCIAPPPGQPMSPSQFFRGFLFPFRTGFPAFVVSALEERLPALGSGVVKPKGSRKT